MKRVVLITLGTLVVLFVLIQFIPYGHQHDNPPVIQEPNWDSPQTRELAVRACFDCHSNQTTYPWYSNVAPISWLVASDTAEGRQHLNFSDWGNVREPYEISQAVRSGWMPMKIFTVMHPEARLTAAEREALAAGLDATVANR